MKTIKRLTQRLWDGFLTYALKFGVVGLLGMVLDVGIFNLLLLGVFGTDHFFATAIGAKLVSTSIAIVFNWVGNRYWTFRENRRKNVGLELVEYALVSVGGLAIAEGCIWFTHHVLGQTSLLATNIAANVVGLALGTAFRFVLYRYWVYGTHRSDGLHNIQAAALAVEREESLV
ncbi:MULTISPECIES: GtrA family protein [Subtercola]|uniref:Flippase GtrA n=1 Tax=Subtercola frigoramans TaxID=120298 RepID=A0ABS2L880_9MICO|nr:MULTISPECIES: GtrA family protein [Subtercola]MBM7473306.1 putative flippase GtrA [Subtercola frigoramans]